MELPFLVESGLLPARVTTGPLQLLPLGLQQNAAAQLIEYLAVDTKSKIKQLRCDEDLRYYIETMGVVFTFSAAEYGNVIKKALDVYFTILLPPFVDEIVPFQGQNREHFMTDMLRHTTQLFSPRTDYPAGTASHTKLIGNLLNKVSQYATAFEGKLKTETWHTIIRSFSGVLHYYGVTDRVFPEVRSALTSVFFEVLVRSKATEEVIWKDVVADFIPKSYAIVAQWGSFAVAITRSITSLLSDRELPGSIHIKFRGMLDNVRKELHLVGYSREEQTFVWKKLLGVFGQLHDLEDEDGLEIGIESLRDIVTLASCATYWEPGTDLYDFRKKHPPAKIALPSNPSTASLIKLAADNLLRTIIRTPKDGAPASPTLVKAKCRALEGACALFLRRETEVAVGDFEQKYLEAFFNVLVSASSEEALWPTLLTNTTSLYLLNISIPMRTLSSLSSVVCSYFFSDKAPQGEAGDTDEDIGDEDLPTGAVNEQHIAVLECAAHHAAGIFSLSSMLRERGVLASLSAALLCAIERYTTSAKLFHKLLCAVLVCTAQRPASVSEDAATFTDIAENVMALLRAPFGTYPIETLCFGMDFLSWLPPITQTTTITIAVSLCTFSQSVRRLEGQVDQSELSTLFETACRALGRMISEKNDLLDEEAVSLSILRAVDTGCKPLTASDGYRIRNSAMRLYYIFVSALGWPFLNNCSNLSHTCTEEDFMDRAVMYKLFEVNGNRVISALEVLPEDSRQEENDVILIVRDAFHRRAFCFRRSVVAAAQPDPLLPIPSLTSEQKMELPVMEEPEDILRFVHTEQRTTSLLETWSKDDTIVSLIKEVDQFAAEALAEGSFSAAPHEYVEVEDTTAACCRLIRFLFTDLSLVSNRTHELPVNENIIATLKGLDEIDSREQLDIPVVFVCDREVAKHSQAFQNFMNGLGWADERESSSREDGDSEGDVKGNPIGAVGIRSERRVFRTLQDNITFHPVLQPIDEFASEEAKAEAILQKEAANNKSKNYREQASVRIVWDATFSKLNWAAVQQPVNDLFQELSPQFTAEDSLRFFTFVISPLPKVGLYSVKLSFPKGLPRNTQIPWMWGAPLIHGVLLSAEALPRMLRIASHHAALQRQKCSNSYVSPLLLRRQALKKILLEREADAEKDTLPTQTIVSLCDGIVPKQRQAQQPNTTPQKKIVSPTAASPPNTFPSGGQDQRASSPATN